MTPLKTLTAIFLIIFSTLSFANNNETKTRWRQVCFDKFNYYSSIHLRLGVIFEEILKDVDTTAEALRHQQAGEEIYKLIVKHYSELKPFDDFNKLLKEKFFESEVAKKLNFSADNLETLTKIEWNDGHASHIDGRHQNASFVIRTYLKRAETNNRLKVYSWFEIDDSGESPSLEIVRQETGFSLEGTNAETTIRDKSDLGTFREYLSKVVVSNLDFSLSGYGLPQKCIDDGYLEEYLKD
jgi:hypothetical protein